MCMANTSVHTSLHDVRDLCLLSPWIAPNLLGLHLSTFNLMLVDLLD